MKKTFKIILLLILSIFLTTGCIKKDNMENINILTTTYPITYLINEIYGSNSTITSIYPNGIDTEKYEITDKQLDEYSSYDLFIYNGLSNKEKTIATSLLSRNKNIKLIDVSLGLSITNDMTELWLSPSNYLMLAQNIADGLKQYVTSNVLTETIETNYQNLKITISKYDAEYKVILEKAANNSVIIANDTLLFLEKYGYNVISIDNNDNFKNANLTEAKNLINNKKCSYVFILDTDDENDEYIQALKNIGATIIKVKSMTNLSVEDVKNNITYKEMVKEFLDNLRNEAYE